MTKELIFITLLNAIFVLLFVLFVTRSILYFSKKNKIKKIRRYTYNNSPKK